MQATVTILGGLEITVEFKACRAEQESANTMARKIAAEFGVEVHQVY